LAVGNYTDCETKETLKKAAFDYRQKMRIDAHILKECRIIADAYVSADVTSTHLQGRWITSNWNICYQHVFTSFLGYMKVIGEKPFRPHLFSEPQIERYAKYCKTVKYSFVHIDATVVILKEMCKQKHSLLHAFIFRDGVDPTDTITLGHAILTDHTVPSISYFFPNLAHGIAQINKKLILRRFL
jgi:hypothetical protein